MTAKVGVSLHRMKCSQIVSRAKFAKKEYNYNVHHKVNKIIIYVDFAKCKLERCSYISFFHAGPSLYIGIHFFFSIATKQHDLDWNGILPIIQKRCNHSIINPDYLWLHYGRCHHCFPCHSFLFY